MGQGILKSAAEKTGSLVQVISSARTEIVENGTRYFEPHDKESEIYP